MTATAWEIFNGFFMWLGELAFFFTVVCLVDRRAAKVAASLWAAWAATHQIACRSMVDTFSARHAELKAAEEEN